MTIQQNAVQQSAHSTERVKVNRHLAAIRVVEQAIADLKSKELSSADAVALKAHSTAIAQMTDDCANLSRLGSRSFLRLLEEDFVSFRTKNPETEKVLNTFAIESKRRANSSNLITTSVTVATPSCPLCGKAHAGYLVKIDKRYPDKPYVVCGTKASRVHVRLKSDEITTAKKVVKGLSALQDLYVPNFEITAGNDTDIELVTRLCAVKTKQN